LPALVAAPRVARAQSLLDRPDNISTDWIGNSGTFYFNFVHRFSVSPPPERKVTNFPTFLIATGIASQALVGVNYATNSALEARYPNEWEFFGRYAPLQQDAGRPFDLGGQADYNLAVKGWDGEVSIARRQGPARLVALTRLIADTLGGSASRFGFGGGGTIRLGRFLALAGDAFSLTNRRDGETVAWSAGFHVALPNTPHTLSIHISNAGTSTLQGVSRGGHTRRYGFEFTIPLPLARFFSNPETTSGVPVTALAPSDSTEPVAAASVAAAPPAPATTPPPARADTTPPPVSVDTTPTKPAPPAAPASAVAPPKASVAPTPRKPAPTAAAAPRAKAKPRVSIARIKAQSFIPSHLEIPVGTTVQWKNLDALLHTVSAVDKSFTSGIISADGSYSHTFTKPGVYQIFCMIHPFMKATVVVK
jgi:plastocyanin